MEIEKTKTEDMNEELIGDEPEQEETERKSPEELGEDFVKFLRDFNVEIGRKIQQIKEQGDFISIKSESEGLVFQAGSQKYDSYDLSNLGLQVFKKLRKDIKHKKPLGVG